MRRLIVLWALGACVSGCGVQADSPPSSDPAYTPPEVAELDADVAEAASVTLPELVRDSDVRRARRLTVRVRNIGCAGVATGSGFALGPNLLVTNRHVIAGADALEVSTWNGRTHEVSTAVVGVLGDVGFAIVEGRLPFVGRFGRAPRVHEPVTAVGYPLGGPLALSPGAVIDRVDGGPFNVPGTVVRLTAEIRPGNSGGPLLDRRGRIVGIVYAIEVSTGFGLAIPVDTMRRLSRVGGFEDIPACGSE